MSLSSSTPVVQRQGGGGEERNSFPTSILEVSLSKADHGNPTGKTSNHQPYLDVPLQSAFARSSDTLSDLSTCSADNDNERRTARLLTVSIGGRLLSTSPAPSPRTWRETVRLFWARNKGLALVTLAQVFGVMMNVTIRLLEMSGASGPGMHPFQVRLAVFMIFPPDTLVLSLIMIDSVCSYDRHSCPQRHLSVVGSSRRSTLWVAGSPRTLDCTWGRWFLRR